MLKRQKMIKKLYILFLVVIPIIVFLLKDKYLYAGIWSGAGFIIFIIEKTKIGKKIEEILF